jgi:hypothetical protein
MVVGKSAFFEQIGVTSALKRTSRHSDTPQMDTPHARRRVTVVDYVWADLVDKEDEVRMLIDPASQYAQAFAWAFGRAMDDEIIAAADGVAYTGEDGTTQTAYDTNMNVAVNFGASGDVGLTVNKLIEAKRILDSKEVDPAEPRFIAANAAQIGSLLKTTQVTSSDYNTVKALVQGEINTFMGFNFIRTERIGKDSSNDDKVLYWAKSGLLLAIGREPKSRISERDDKNYATQVFYSMTIGATRMQENKVGVIACDPAGSPT